MAQAWRLVLNPSDKTSGYVLWTNGRIDTFGSAVLALPSPDGGGGEAGYPSDYNDPINPDPVIALTITDWDTPGGYSSNYYGQPNAWGGATQPLPATVTSTSPNRVVVDVQMNPDGSGQGYYLRNDGTIVPIGDAPSIGTYPLPAPIARRLIVDWPTGRWYLLTSHRDVVAGNGATPPSPAVPDVNQDAARDFSVDFATASGWVLDLHGNVLPFGTAEAPFGGPQWPSGDVARGLGVISDGTGGNPMTLTILDLNGNLHTFTSSTAPTVTAGGVSHLPPDPETVTSRPVLPWSYSQPQGDAQASWKVRVYYDETGLDPDTTEATPLFAAAGADATSRSVTPDVDLPNGDLLLCVQATSTAGQSSVWSFRGWTQDLTPLDPPTVLTATADPSSPGTVDLHVETGTVADGALLLVQYSDASSDVWQPVRGLDAMPAFSNWTAGLVDREAPLNVPRSYQAKLYVPSPYNTSLPTATSTATATGATFLLTTPTSYYGVGGPVTVTGAFVRTRHARGGTFLPAGRIRAVRISDGPPSTMTGTLTVTGLDSTQTADLETMLSSDLTLLFRDTHGHANYLALTGNLALTRVGSGPGCAWTYTADVTEVDRPAG